MKQFKSLAGDQLKGDWVVLGGTVLPFLNSTYRVTVDIDIAPIKKEMDQTLKLMEICEQLKLPIETINRAASFFLYKIDKFEENLEILHKGKSASIFIPNLILFINLKIDRFSESDYTDCLEYIKYYKKNKKEIPIKEILILVKKKLKSEKNQHKKDRYTNFIEVIDV